MVDASASLRRSANRRLLGAGDLARAFRNPCRNHNASANEHSAHSKETWRVRNTMTAGWLLDEQLLRRERR